MVECVQLVITAVKVTPFLSRVLMEVTKMKKEKHIVNHVLLASSALQRHPPSMTLSVHPEGIVQ